MDSTCGATAAPGINPTTTRHAHVALTPLIKPRGEPWATVNGPHASGMESQESGRKHMDTLVSRVCGLMDPGIRYRRRKGGIGLTLPVSHTLERT